MSYSPMKNKRQAIVRSNEYAPAVSYGTPNYPAPAQVSEALAISKLRNDATASLAFEAIGNYTALMNICEAADKICPSATEANTQIAKAYQIKAFGYISEWDRGF